MILNTARTRTRVVTIPAHHAGEPALTCGTSSGKAIYQELTEALTSVESDTEDSINLELVAPLSLNVRSELEFSCNSLSVYEATDTTHEVLQQLGSIFHLAFTRERKKQHKTTTCNNAAFPALL